MILITKSVLFTKQIQSNRLFQNLFKRNNVQRMNIGCKYSFSSSSMIGSVQEVIEGRKFYEQKNMVSAQQMFERALSILPNYIENNQAYNGQLNQLLEELILSYTWRGDLSKVESVMKKYKQNSRFFSQKINKIYLILTLLNRSDRTLTQNETLISKRISEALNNQKRQKYSVQKELTLSVKEGANSQSIQDWIHGDLKETWLFILSSLLGGNSIAYNSSYNKICNSLLKNTERSFPKNVIKPLIFITSNLLRKAQYLQAEGMLTYCIDRKKQNIKPDLLRFNQEYILLNLLLSRCFEGVDRAIEAKRLADQYRPVFNLQILLLQGYLLDSI